MTQLLQNKIMNLLHRNVIEVAQSLLENGQYKFVLFTSLMGQNTIPWQMHIIRTGKEVGRWLQVKIVWVAQHQGRKYDVSQKSTGCSVGSVPIAHCS